MLEQNTSLVMARYLLSSLLGCSLLLSGVTLSGCGSKEHESPEAVFEAAKSALADEDMEGFMNCLTPESQDLFSGMLVMLGTMMKGFAALAGDDPDALQSVSKIEKVLETHGLSEDVMGMMESADESDPAAAMQKLVEPIKDKAAFVGDMFEIFNEMDDSKRPSPGDQFKGALKDIKIDGDSASAVLEDGGKSEPVQFRKVEGSWLIHLDPAELGGFPGS